ncbi:MAG TPA: hypothetical protein PKX91_04160 [Clostridia bacterium]|jgi:hypothetical protein|nr:hypothetical protein [Clostridia bacterium]
MKKLDLMYTPDKREDYNNQMHSLGRIFTWVSLGFILIVPIAYLIAAKTWPNWTVLAKCIPFILGYWAIGLIEAVSYAPLLGTGGQYLSFITGNISNLKLPAAINAQTIAKVEQGSEEQEVITTIAIAVSSIVTTVIILIGLIPLIIWQEQIVKVLTPISPYVLPAIFGALTLVVIAMYAKIAAIPFLACIIISIIANAVGFGLDVATMIIVGMVISAISTTIMYRIQSKKIAAKEKAAIATLTESEPTGEDVATSDKVEDTSIEEVAATSTEIDSKDENDTAEDSNMDFKSFDAPSLVSTEDTRIESTESNNEIDKKEDGK